MPPAVAVGLPEPALQISASHRGYQSHFSHAGERIWPETNCYLDLRIETLHALGLDPVPAFVWLPPLETVPIDASDWIPSDNFFHLLAATPYSVRLQRYCDQAAPLGKAASVDSLGTATITASA
jgi:hypothetical protein